MDDDRFFAETLNDLRAREARGEEYELLRAAALLRQLLLDSNPLLDRVNRGRCLTVRFAVAGDPEARQNVVSFLREHDYRYMSLLDSVDPEVVPNAPVNQLTRQQFLSLPMIYRGERKFTVRDIIDLAANVMGGVHRGTSRHEQQAALSEFGNVFVGGLPATTVDLRPIVRIVLRALEPLSRAIADGD